MWQHDEEEDHSKPLLPAHCMGLCVVKITLAGSKVVFLQNFLWEYAVFSHITVAGKTKIALQ